MGIEQFFKDLFHDDNDDPATPVTLPPLAATPMTAGRVLLIHGYSADWKGFVPWHDALKAAGIDTTPIAIGNYVTLNNEVTIKDLGEAFDRALLYTPWSTGTKDDSFTFDAIVHSTGMLVLRQWLTCDPTRVPIRGAGLAASSIWWVLLRPLSVRPRPRRAGAGLARW